MYPGLLMTGVGVLILWCVVKGFTFAPKMMAVIGLHFCLVGILIIVFIKTDNDLALLFTISWGIGIVVMWAAGASISKLFICSKKVTATFIGASPCTGGKGLVKYSPMFKFILNNSTFMNQSGEVYSGVTIKRKYEVGNEYPIYVNPKNPYVIITKKRIRLSTLNLLICGLAFMAMPFVVMSGVLKK